MFLFYLQIIIQNCPRLVFCFSRRMMDASTYAGIARRNIQWPSCIVAMRSVPT